MPVLTDAVAPAGPIVELMVGVTEPRRDALLRVGFPVPARVRVRALIDTGTSITAIAPEVLYGLDLRSHGTLPVLTPSTGATPHECEQYDVSLGIFHPDLEFFRPIVAVIASHFAEQEGIQAMLGRDVLDDCLFVYNGQTKTFSLAF
jgi:hypothetical protein